MINDWSQILEKINSTLNEDHQFSSISSVSGGDINDAYHLKTSLQSESVSFFVKTNQASKLSMFAAEASSLKLFNQVQALVTPKPICHGIDNSSSYLVMTYLPLTSRGDQYQLGQAIAQMHKVKANKFGWEIDNTIGATPQYNHQMDNWLEFWITQRYQPQLSLLKEKGRLSNSLNSKMQKLINNLEQYFINHQPSPSLLHGDLWGGNFSFDQNGQPAIYDPALYFGDRETDIAMTELFGGFNQDFYRGYQETYPLADSYKIRKPVYNLYHILNHANLFGSSYAMQAEQMAEKLI
ncbi:MAG: fructosamine kinase family protein [Gammaproteobacteria bacterium]|nr:fructosamine kinase family protein [Gammaproteobacteria bacterium]